MTQCNICNRKFPTTSRAFFASQDSFALAEMLANIQLEVHMLSHVIPIGNSLEKRFTENLSPH